MREYPCLPDSDSSSIFFFGQQKPFQAITNFIDAWVILSLRTDVASQETIIQRAILNTWIAPQNHKLLTWLHAVIWKCKVGKREKHRTREKLEWRNAKVIPHPPALQKKEHTIMTKKALHEKPNVTPLDFFFFTYTIILSKLSPMKEFLSTVWMFILSWISLEKSTDRLDVYISSILCHLPTCSLLGMV